MESVLTTTAIETVIDLIGVAIQDTTNNDAVTKAINAIEAWAPIVIKDAPQFWQRITEATSILFGSDDLTDDQVQTLVNARAALKAARAAANAKASGGTA